MICRYACIFYKTMTYPLLLYINKQTEQR